MIAPRTRGWILLLIGAACMIAPGVARYYYIPQQHILVAQRTLADAHFRETVVLVNGNALTGWFGLVLNRPLTTAQQAQLPPFLRGSGIRVDHGGPVDFPDSITVLERYDLPDSEGRLYRLMPWDEKAPADLAARISADQKQSAPHFRVFAGYAGWGMLQLETELSAGRAWHRLPLQMEILWQQGAEHGWKALENRQFLKRAPKA